MQHASRDVISLLLEHGADTELTVEHNQTPLFYAANIAATQELLKHGANVNHQNCFEQTPLFCAANSTQADELVRNGANVNQRSKYGQTPILYAVQMSRSDVVSCLISHGADVNVATCANAGEELGLKHPITPLRQVLKSMFFLPELSPVHSDCPTTPCKFPVEQIERYFDIIEFLVPLCDDLAFARRPGRWRRRRHR